MYSREETKRFLATQVARPASAGVVIENDNGEALVLKAHYKAYWSFPGGWIEHGQSPREAATRELREETGYSIGIDDVEFLFFVDRHSDIMQTYQFIFKAKQPVQPDMQFQLQPDEIEDFMFVSKEHVKNNQDQFGGAVIAWSKIEGTVHAPGYYEQRVD